LLAGFYLIDPRLSAKPVKSAVYFSLVLELLSNFIKIQTGNKKL